MIKLVIAVFLLGVNLFPQSDDWKTKFELSGYLETPRYEETMEYFKRLSEASPYAEMFNFGASPQGRDLNAVIISKEKNFKPSDLSGRKKPLLLIVNGIHAGEIEGKDASMLLLREILISKEKEHYLDKADLLIVPIFNVDGHERFGPYNRINQQGPSEMGWRSTAQNLNLNRDWTKADAPEMQALLKLFSKWLPDFLIDSHTTNGADYQYTITYGVEKNQNIEAGLREWTVNRFIPYMQKYVEDAGFITMPYIDFKEWFLGFEGGIVEGAFGPRYSQGYAAVQNRPGLLIETHMMKPFKERVFSTKAMFESIILLLNEDAEKLLSLNKKADKSSIKKYREEKEYFPIGLSVSDSSEEFTFKGFEYIKDSSDISGGLRTTYTDKPKDFQLKRYKDVYVSDSVLAPKGYYIPAQYKEITEKLNLHGIDFEIIDSDVKKKVTRFKFKDVKFAQAPFEGRQRVSFSYETFEEETLIPKGSYYISTDQREIRLILHLLEPKGDDSFLKWGFFNPIFERKEYFEMYVLEKLAKQMLSVDPKLKEEFEIKLREDEEFKNNPWLRLFFFFERSPYNDKQINLYPVMRLEN